MKDKIQALYPGQAEGVTAKLQIILDEFRQRHPELAMPPRNRFDQRDVILSCYADHVREDGVHPLNTLKKFLLRFAQGILNRVHLLPFYPSTSDDGFSVVDFRRVNESFGDWSDISALGQEFDLMFDCVANHVSASSDWFRGYQTGNPKYQNFFVAFDQPMDVSSVFRPRTHPLLTRFETHQGPRNIWTTFSADQIDLNYPHPDVLMEMVKVLLFYVEQGARAIRLDAIAYAWKKLGTSCFNLSEVHILVQLIHEILAYVAPRVWIITETVLPHDQNISYFGNGHNAAHGVYHFQLETLLLHTILRQDAMLLGEWINGLPDFSDQNAMLNLSVSHDGIHPLVAKDVLSEEQMLMIAQNSESKGGQVLYRTTADGGREPYEFNITYPSAVGGVDAYLASQAVMLAIRGVPFIYLNNLIGAENWTQGVRELGYSRAINRQKFDFSTLVSELQDSASPKGRTYSGYARLLRARQKEPLFSPVAKQDSLALDPSIMAIRRQQNDSRLLALTNVSAAPVRLQASKISAALGKAKAEDLLHEGILDLQDDLTLEPYQSRWLK